MARSLGFERPPRRRDPSGGSGRARESQDQATDAAIAHGRGDLLRELRSGITEWALEQYRRQGFGAIYFQPAMEPPEQRRDAIEVMTDAATANLVADLVPQETVDTLVARFAIIFGSPGFSAAPSDDG